MNVHRTHRIVLGAATALLFAACGDDGGPSAVADTGADLGAADTGEDIGTDAPLDGGGDVSSDTVEDVDADTESGDATDTGEPLEWCQGATAHVWDPFESAELEFFPDGLYMREDETSPTGWRLDYGLDTPWVAGAPPLLIDSIAALYDLSGFGTLGGVLVRFSEPVLDVPTGAEASTTDRGWRWVRLDGDSLERVPFDARILEDGLTVVLWPQVPLELDAEYAFVVTREALAADGGCIAPSATTRALINGTPSNERLQRFASTYQDALVTMGIEPADVSVLSVYRTHNDIGAVVRAAADVVERPVEWGDWLGCAPRSDHLVCETSTTVLDYRNESGLVDDTREPVEASIPITVWRPEAAGPWPVAVYGHGLNSERREGELIADRLVELGFVIVAMEAVEHGEHPSVHPDSTDLPALRFLGVDLNAFVIDALAIRGNFNQTNLDRLRLIELLRQSPDLDGDGVDDIDPTRVTYVGASLGAMTGTGLLALSSDLDAAALTIGGARLLSIVSESNLIGDYVDIIDFVIGSEVLFDRLVPIAQHVVDPADPGLWAARVLHDRLDGRDPPSLLVNVGMDDEVVPPESGYALARALGIAHLAPVAVPVDTLTVVDGPVSGNRADGRRTAAYFQLDRITRRSGEVTVGDHVATAKSEEVAEQMRAFFGPWADGELPVIVDPYAILGTPALDVTD